MSENFDLQAAWLRRFVADAQGNVGAFARRLKEAMPEHVVVQEKKSLFGPARITGVTVEMGERRYVLDASGSRLRTSVALVVRGIALQTRDLDAADWFAQLTRETQQASAQADALSRSLAQFMAH